MIIGGEHYFNPANLFVKSKGYIDTLEGYFKDVYEISFTFGGFHSLLAIIDDIRSTFDSDSVVLLPSYLCSSMLIPFKIRQINYRFYKIDKELYIDTEHLITNIDNNVKAVLFIDYFGASQKDRLVNVLNLLKEKKIKIIQDLVQCINIDKKQLLGDYMYNSFRKYLPFEGSLLLSKTKMQINYTKPKFEYLLNKRIGQILRYYHLKYNVFSSRPFLQLFKKAENHYSSANTAKMPEFNRLQLNKVDIDQLSTNQKHFYQILLKEYSHLVPQLMLNEKFVPLGFVIKTDNRDQIRHNLFIENIFPPIHWLLSNEIDKQTFRESVELSNKILTIPIFYLNETKLKYLLKNIKTIIKS